MTASLPTLDASTPKRALGLVLAMTATALLLGPEPSAAQEVKNAIQVNLLKQVAFEQNLDAQLPLETPLRDEEGRPVTLRDFFGKKKPVVLVFVYFECPMLCKVELNGLVRNLRTLSLSAGKEFDIVTVSIDPRETPKLATVKKRNYLNWYDRAGAENGWHFLTGEEPAIKRLTGVAGFRYAYDEKNDQYAHPAGLIVATPEGRISRYVYGVDFPASALRWALVEASAGKVGTPVDKILLMCFHYDPATGRYSFAIMSALRILGSATVLALGTYVLTMYLRDRRRAAERSAAGTGAVGI